MGFTPDDLERRCPRLGGPVTFRYCRFAGSDRSMCWKIADCWWERFDVMTYLRGILSEPELNALLAKRPKQKVSSIIELIEQARRRAGNETDTD
jgi:hypothetical protein